MVLVKPVSAAPRSQGNDVEKAECILVRSQQRQRVRVAVRFDKGPFAQPSSGFLARSTQVTGIALSHAAALPGVWSAPMTLGERENGSCAGRSCKKGRSRRIWTTSANF